MKPKINPFFGVLTAVLVLLTLALCVIGSRVGVVLVKTDVQPGETVETFFAALTREDWESAYACLEDYSGLGLDRSPRTEQGKAELAALLKSYDFSLTGEAKITRDTAVQPVRLRCLDLVALEEALKVPLIEASETRPARYYTVEELLAENRDFTRTEELEIQLRYTDGAWRITVDPALLNALAGGKEAKQ